MSGYFEDELDGASQPGRAHGVTGVDAEQLLPADPDASGVDHDGAEKDEQPSSHEEMHEETYQEGSSEADEEQLRKRKQKKKKLLLIAAAGLVMASGLYGLMDETPAPRKPANGTNFEEPSAARRSNLKSGSEEFVPAAAASMPSEPASTLTASTVPVSASAVSLAASAPAPAPAPLAQEVARPIPSATPASSTPVVVPASAALIETRSVQHSEPEEVKRPARAERPSVPVRQTARPHAASPASSAAPERTITLTGYHLDAIYPTSGDANLIAYIRTPAGARTVKVGDVLPNGVKVEGIRNSNRSMKTTAGTLKME